MSDDLDMQVTEPEPVAPEPTPEPAAEPEPQGADWLNEPATPEPPQPPPPQYPPQPPAQYPQQPQYQRPPQQPIMSEGEIEEFIRQGPSNFNRAIVQEQLAPVQNQVMGMMGAVQNYLQAEVARAETSAKTTIDQAYRDVFSKDEAFRSNPELKRRIDASLQGLLNNATQAAKQGYFDDLNMMRNFGPAQARAALAAAKAMIGVPGTAAAPMEVAGAVVESPTPSVPRADVQLSADEEAIIAARSRADEGFRERYLRARQETEAAGDFEAY